MNNMQIIDRAMRLYKAHPVHRGTRPLSWTEAPSTVRYEFSDKARISRTFIVEGRGEFPKDMLRYDECVPATDADEKLVNSDYKSGRYRVTLLTAKRFVTNARWTSFGWTVMLDVDGIGPLAMPDTPPPRPKHSDELVMARLGPKLVAALEASHHTLHREDESGPCLCSQCAFVRLRDEVLAEVKAAS